MTPDSDQPPATTPGDPDPLDDTQPIEVPRFAPTPDPRPDARWAWATPEPGPPTDRWYEPAPPEPTASPVPAPSWAAPASSTSAAWAAPEPAGAAKAPAWAVPTPSQAPSAPARRRSGAGVGTIVAVALLAAIIASGGTALVLGRSGAFDQPAPVPTPGTGQGAGGTSSGPSSGPTAGTVDESSAVITSAAKVSPAVVKITTTGTGSDPFGAGQTDGVGSGIIYDANGWILTNHHVVTGAQSLTVELKDGRSFTGTVYGIDTLTDLAIVKVDATGLPAASLGSSDALKVGQLVVAVGSPLGTYSFSVTSGIVSGKGRQITVSDGSRISNLIQTDAAINPGNSGGPLADAQGNVVGINTAVADGSSGIGFAIPIDIAKPIMGQAVKGEKLERPYIGITFQSIDQAVKQLQKLTADNGALITNSGSTGSAVKAGSPAEKAGLRDGDIITAINGIAVDQEHPLDALLVQFAPNDTISLTVLRGGQTITVPVTLSVRPANLQ